MPPPLDTPTPEPDVAERANLLDQLRASFPWIDQIGLSPQFFQDLVAGAASSAEIITTLRQQPQYRARFQGLWRQDGSVRMTEAEFLRTEGEYRQLLRQYGFAAEAEGPVNQFFESEQDPNELRERLQTFRQVQEGGRAVREAFYVYAGMRLSDEDLYSATVDPTARAGLYDEYNRRVSSSTFDYSTWITRATEVANERVADTLSGLQRQGALTGQAVQTVLRTDPNFARQMMDALYTGGTGGADAGLSLQELLSAYEYAAIGAAASQAGLSLPTRERIAEIRAAGVDRARASQAYMQYGQSRGALEAAAERQGTTFTQSEFEQAALLGNADAANKMQRIVAAEQAAGEGQGQFRFDVGRQGQLRQDGMRTAF